MIKKLMLIAAVIVAISLIASGMALAYSAESTYTVGNPGINIPHGGFSASSDACLQCHDIHEASADYVLLRYETVADTCGSCHYLYLQNPGTTLSNTSNPKLGGYDSKTAGSGDFVTGDISPAYNPGYGTTDTPYNPARGFSGTEEASLFTTTTPQSTSLGSEWSAYEVPFTGGTPFNADDAPGHQLQRGTSVVTFNDGTTNTRDYIPGGTNRLMAIAKDGVKATMATTNTMTFTATNGLFCTSCHTPHGTFGKLMQPTASDTDSVRIRRKLLSAQPNHSFTSGTVSIGSWIDEGGSKWCGRCHDKRTNNDPAIHTHPDSVCLKCHGAPGGSGSINPKVSNMDFPHTSTNINLLQLEPDELCITCHISGYLP